MSPSLAKFVDIESTRPPTTAIQVESEAMTPIKNTVPYETVLVSTRLTTPVFCGMIKSATNCQIIVGQNGVVWLSGEPKNVRLAQQAIRKIEAESHVAGLTEDIKNFLQSNGSGVK